MRWQVVQEAFPWTHFVTTATCRQTRRPGEICTDTHRQDAICLDPRRPEGYCGAHLRLVLIRPLASRWERHVR